MAAPVLAQPLVPADRDVARAARALGLTVSTAEEAGQRLPSAFHFDRNDAMDAKRPILLTALYVGLGVTQALDLYSTRLALSRGARETNPLMAGAMRNQGSAIAVKLATTAGTIYFAEKLRKKSPIAAIFVTAAINGVTAAVVANNMRVADVAARR